MPESPKIIVYGYGNPGRQDDVLGVKLAELVNEWAKNENIDFITTDTNYQLNIEDAATINEKKLVIFADASKEEIEDFKFMRLKPDSKVDFTMHHVLPGFILYLCKEIYGCVPETYLLHIKGYEWEFLAEPTEKAILNLNKAFDFLKSFISDYLLNN